MRRYGVACGCWVYDACCVLPVGDRDAVRACASVTVACVALVLASLKK